MEPSVFICDDAECANTNRNLKEQFDSQSTAHLPEASS